MTLPNVETREALNIGEESADLRGRLADLGGADEAQVWFDWGTSSRRLTNSTRSRSLSRSITYQRGLSNLQPDTTYYYRFIGQNDAGLTAGSVNSFTTKSGEQHKINCSVRAGEGSTGRDCGTTVEDGGSARIGAHPASGWEFVRWDIDGETNTSRSAYYTVDNITDDVDALAFFREEDDED